MQTRTIRTRSRVLARIGILGLLAGGLASAAYQALGEARDRRRFPPPGELVDLGGRRLHLWRAGEGSPAVVIATSLGEPAYGWAELQRRLAQHTTVVVYDRAGLGWSDPGPWPTGKQTVDDLHALLHAARIPAPYVLVGHSAGGLHMRLYAARHPEQVAGLMLVDASHPDQSHRLRQRCGGWQLSRPAHWLRVAKRAFRPLGLARLRGSLRAQYGHAAGTAELGRGVPPELAEAAAAIGRSSRQRRAAVRELLAFFSVAAEASRVVAGTPGSLGRLPLTVITRGATDPPPWPACAEAIWQELQAELSLLSQRGIHLHAQSGDHFVHRSDPDLVARAIAALVDQVRATA
jgi:pimeloyl-ACP methyl ester carboxylesterase